MSFLARFGFLAVIAAGWLLTGGCVPSDSSQQDEEKEPHYVLGKSRVNAMDFEGAVESFKESLGVNPRSASAHFQLACLFDTRISDPAAAIYHYQEFLRLNPKADNAEVVKQRIYSCKQQLAADVLPLPSTPAAQKQLETLAETNRLLQAQVAQLNESVRQWSDYAAGLQAGKPANSTPLRLAEDTTAAGAGARQTATATTTAARARTHVVAAGDTLASIARKYGVSLTALQAANPGVTPKKLKVGQTLNLPGH